MEKNKFIHLKGGGIPLEKSGAYEVIYLVSIPPSRALEADFFLRCNTAVLGTSVRHIRKKSGYRLMVWEKARCRLEKNDTITVDAFPRYYLQETKDPILCFVSANRLPS